MPSSVPPSGPSFSFEFFPPKSEKAVSDLDATASALAALGPAYMTVTYGAGGTTRAGTLDTVIRLKKSTGLPMAAHLTFCATPKAELDTYIDQLWEAGIRHLVALRGDLPPGKSMADFTGDEYYHYTSDFVTALRQRHPFEISVGAYPEKHPDAPSLALDIEALKKKCGAGSARAITQFFFDNSIYYRFLDETEKAGITTPIIPGLLPISDYEKVRKFAQTCRASIPHAMHEKFRRIGDNQDEARRFAADILIAQIEDLKRNGIPHIHFYALNRSELCLQACKATGLAPASVIPAQAGI